MTALDQYADAGTTAVRDAHRFDEAALAAWMAENVAGFSGGLTVAQFKGCQSNPTYRLDAGDRAYVLRRSPPGPIVKGAHDVLREARILSALAATDVPVTRIHGTRAGQVPERMGCNADLRGRRRQHRTDVAHRILVLPVQTCADRTRPAAECGESLPWRSGARRDRTES